MKYDALGMIETKGLVGSIEAADAMVKAAARAGLLDERRTVDEIFTAFFRAGADLVITYHALDWARWRREGV